MIPPPLCQVQYWNSHHRHCLLVIIPSFSADLGIPLEKETPLLLRWSIAGRQKNGKESQKKGTEEKRKDFFSKPMMTKTTVLFLLLFLRSQLSCVILSTLFAPIYDNDWNDDRVRHIEGQALVTSLTTVSLLLSLLTTSSRFCRNLI